MPLRRSTVSKNTLLKIGIAKWFIANGYEIDHAHSPKDDPTLMWVDGLGRLESVNFEGGEGLNYTEYEVASQLWDVYCRINDYGCDGSYSNEN
jgi:hypothetical protein